MHLFLAQWTVKLQTGTRKSNTFNQNFERRKINRECKTYSDWSGREENVLQRGERRLKCG
jgi:hypothetical protein